MIEQFSGQSHQDRMVLVGAMTWVPVGHQGLRTKVRAAHILIVTDTDRDMIHDQAEMEATEV
jgi:hypothetical protein